MFLEISRASEGGSQILHGPRSSPFLQTIRGGAMLPNAKPDRLQGIGLQLWLREQSAEITREKVPGTALGEMRVARAVEIDLTRGPTDDCLKPFQNHPAVAGDVRVTRVMLHLAACPASNSSIAGTPSGRQLERERVPPPSTGTARSVELLDGRDDQSNRLGRSRSQSDIR